MASPVERPVERPSHPGGVISLPTQACSECPWRIANQGRPDDQRGWYTPKNLARIWTALREGHAQTCHPTDWRANGSRGYETAARPGHTSECAGSLTLVFREMDRLLTMGSVPEYLAAFPRGLTQQGIATTIWRWSQQQAPSLNLQDPEIWYAEIDSIGHGEA